VTLVIMGATRTILKSSKKCLSNILGKYEIKGLQKAAILGSAHILWEELMYKYRTFNMGNNITCSTNCNYRTAATLHTLQTLFRFIIVKTLHKCNN